MRNNFRNLEIWQMAVNVVDQCYAVCLILPKVEQYNLSDQIRRSSVAIPANIAEGCGTNSNKHFSSYLSIALGSSYELETHLIICKNRNYLTDDRFNDLTQSIQLLQSKIYKLRELKAVA